MLYKKLKITLLLVAFAGMASAQQDNAAKKSPLIGFSGNLTDFSASLPKVGHVDPGFSLMFWNGITRKLDYSVRYNGLFSDYKSSGAASSGYINEFEGSFHARALNDEKLVNPFLSAGLGIGNYGKNWSPYAPLGLGVQFNLLNEAYIFLQGNYRLSFNENKLDNNTFYSLGFTQSLRDKKPEAPKPIPVVVEEVKDTDGDGVPDTNDQCPGTPAGVKVDANGCPVDSDGDKVPDHLDKCPGTPAGVKVDANGCPVDSDGDGIADHQDKCPDVAGLAKYGGCPMPDRDKDGIADEEDRCPDLAGIAANNGCPEIKEEVKKVVSVAAQNIYFATGSAKLLAKSHKSLDEVAKILEADADLKLDIHGHTDNTGKADKNQVLSENRAKSVYDYLVKKGIAESRLVSAGFGQDEPVADNKTAAGRQQNRRVELKLHYD